MNVDRHPVRWGCDGAPSRTAARRRAILGLAGPAALAVLLPTPRELISRVGGGTDAIRVLGAAMMLAASVVVWGLLAWALLVGTAAVLARLPGGAGRTGRVLLRTLAPAAARRILIVATGVSLVAGASACGTAAVQGAGHGVPAASTAASTPATSPATAPASMASTTSTASTANTVTGPAYQDGGYAGPGTTTTGGGPHRSPTTGPGSAGNADAAIGPAAAQLNLDWPMPDRTPEAQPGPVTPPRHPTGRASAPVATGPTSPATTTTTTASTAAQDLPSPEAPSSPAAASTSPADPTRPATPASPRSGHAGVPSAAPAGRPSAAPAGRPGAAPAGRPGATSPGRAASPSHGAGPSAAPSAGPSAGPSAAPAAAPAARGGPRKHPPKPIRPTHPDRPALTVTVRPGDSLWAIAARHLPAGATDAQIDAGWRAWYAANRAVIGGDPDLILPGQHLTAPHTEGTTP